MQITSTDAGIRHRRFHLLCADPEHLRPVQACHRCPGPSERWPRVHAEAVPGSRLDGGPALRRCRGIRGLPAVQQAGQPSARVQHGGERGLSPGLRAVSGAQAAYLPGSDRGEHGLQPGMSHLLRQCGQGVQPDDGGGGGDAGQVRGAGGPAGGGPVQRRRAHHPPSDPGHGAGRQGAGHPPCDAQHQRPAHCQRRPLSGGAGGAEAVHLPPVRWDSRTECISSSEASR